MPLGWPRVCLEAVPSACAKAEPPPPQPGSQPGVTKPPSHWPPPQHGVRSGSLELRHRYLLWEIYLEASGGSEADVGQQLDQIKL